MTGMTRHWFLTATGAVVAAGAASACDTTATGGSRATPQVSSLPEPVAFLRTSWSTDPFALGSYSYLAPQPARCVRTRDTRRPRRAPALRR
ncbi:FAD-dependent oxidoreductase [Streptomyces sp. NPDC058256]|uniref:FAD-dependent oxidoreductase n=1 Tax=Streptomyces sp. NPDC058256 TaxID=3346408 RepID=UPI0036EE2E36